MNGAQLPPGTPGPGEVRSWRGTGGRVLRYREVAAERPRHRLVYLHGIESHGTWFLPAAWSLREQGVTTYLLDRRGSGLNRTAAPGESGPGDARSADELLGDIDAFRDSLGDPPLALAGLSWGAKLAAAAAMARPDNTQALVLVTPGLVPRVDLSPVAKLRLMASLPFGGGARVAVPIRSEMFTDDPQLLDFIRGDDWRLQRVTARLLMAGRELDRRVRRGLPRFPVPVLLFLAGGDRIIDNEGTRDLLEALPSGRLCQHLYADAIHSIQLDQRERMVADTLAFLDGIAGAGGASGTGGTGETGATERGASPC